MRKRFQCTSDEVKLSPTYAEAAMLLCRDRSDMREIRRDVIEMIEKVDRLGRKDDGRRLRATWTRMWIELDPDNVLEGKAL